ncbi:MAG: hypothetical protein BWX99_00482 [Deltaproteobacteria bacterium ADurb.Bin151]|jgi:hypothetical protein|nr:DUF4911 domain-containing protein [Smithella sp.]OQB56697.1 MAG: hypothetical protein BWX99_00482 [Deltaproteobacteria bacterium ADurb.Bin151]HNZ10544.1 DUF4911 domain-containing protein [Smithellaceae bacterium]HOG81107.1 DUF4911 domain-containing protein [Smithellaceae bacterium]HOQ41858.1 DUF4911 domain-containing protein [Smithellaceae bacterium]
MQRKWFKIKASDIALLQFILEGYEGLVTVSTIDPRDAIIQISIMPDFAEDVECILEDLKERFMMKEIPSCHLQVNPC